MSMNSWALLIGVNQYKHFPSHLQLNYAVNDVEALQRLLIDCPRQVVLEIRLTQISIRCKVRSINQFPNRMKENLYVPQNREDV